MARYLSLLLIGPLIACLTVLAAGEEKTVKLKDGGAITGEVSKTKTGYLIKTKYGEVEIPADRVASITEPASPEAEYQKRLSQIDPNSADAHVALGEWAESQNMLAIARKEFQTALSLDKNNEKAALLLRRVEAKIGSGAETSPAASAPGGAGAVTAPPVEVVPSGSSAPIELLSDEDIYRVRRAEWKQADRVRFVLRNKVDERFVQSQRGQEPFKSNPNAAREFLARPDADKAREILDKTPRTDTGILDDVLIEDDPSFMLEFRRIWPNFNDNCGAVQCHGAPAGKGGFKLIHADAGNKARDYTNFILLSGMVYDNARVINRSFPDKSLLLQYSLPRGPAVEFEHPKKQRLTPRFNSVDDDGYKRTLDWIRTLNPQPNYRLEYKPPAYVKLQFGTASSALERILNESPSQSQPASAP